MESVAAFRFPMRSRSALQTVRHRAAEAPQNQPAFRRLEAAFVASVLRTLLRSESDLAASPTAGVVMEGLWAFWAFNALLVGLEAAIAAPTASALVVPRRGGPPRKVVNLPPAVLVETELR